ncbi:hypothetical protein A2U01_0090558, partial [Trifolium medium]|nr:hypothetical protein [Trifolium medium]
FVVVLLCSPPFVWVEMTCGGPDLLWWVVAVLSPFSASRSPHYVGKFGVVKVGGGDAILP